MGFFGKLKQNFNHGGVKIDLQAPSSVSESDAGFMATVSITNTSEADQNIKTVTAKLLEDQTQSFTIGAANNNVNNSNMQREISTFQDSNPFVLQPGETKQINLNVPLNFGKFAAESMPDNAFMQSAANALSGIQKLADVMDNSNFKHYVMVTADVDGIAFDPSARQDIQVLKPGQIGGALNLHL